MTVYLSNKFEAHFIKIYKEIKKTYAFEDNMNVSLIETAMFVSYDVIIS